MRGFGGRWACVGRCGGLSLTVACANVPAVGVSEQLEGARQHFTRVANGFEMARLFLTVTIFYFKISYVIIKGLQNA